MCRDYCEKNKYFERFTKESEMFNLKEQLRVAVELLFHAIHAIDVGDIVQLVEVKEDAEVFLQDNNLMEIDSDDVELSGTIKFNCQMCDNPFDMINVLEDDDKQTLYVCEQCYRKEIDLTEDEYEDGYMNAINAINNVNVEE